MIKLKKRWLVSLILCIGFIVGFMPKVDASELKFSVEPVLPENQKSEGHTYFDLNMTPNQKQVLKVHMRNDTDKEVVVKPSIHAATTNINGVVEYGESNTKVDKTIKYSLENIVKPTVDEVKIPAKGAKDLELNVQMPEEKFEGVLAGGITLEEKEETKKDEKNKAQGLAIENKYAYVVAVVLHESEEKVASELKLTNVEPGQVNARNVINATIQNTQPKYMNQLTIDTKITKNGQKEVLYSSKKESMQMAPNSSFAYPVSLNGKELKPGKYTLDMVAHSMKQDWHFTKEFEIKADVAKKLNKTDVSIEKSNTWMYLLIGSLFMLIIILVFILLYRKKKEKNRNAKKRKKQSKKR
ncbi:DUF916 and DUF3324 domain-containing protein [Enterococcus termitis]|uniref:Cell wall anchor protein n=1 Tax=Enterococcus termitis TaxID=332950 RepID=A0A1E5GZI1_9ENTE|nr:DUF916 and DUF3324 domain-containing protein [Enterococcus termitis]OEG18131.1 cell wall anchor protein [Enterococcus termitis]OJG97164.1 cell wall surface anchor protein [Enterococcus termitis]